MNERKGCNKNSSLICVRVVFRFIILGELETRELSSTNNCRKHLGKHLKYFCCKCNLSICETCWTNDHDGDNHQIKLFELVLKPEKDICDRFKDYKEQTTQFVNKFHSVFEQFVKDVCDLEKKQIQVMKSRNNEELMNKRQVVREMVARQTEALIKIQKEVSDQCRLNIDRLANLFQLDSDRENNANTCRKTHSSETPKERNETVTSQIRSRNWGNLKSLGAIKLTCGESFECGKAVYNWSTQQIICSELHRNVVGLLGLNSEKNSVTVEHRVIWEAGLRGKESVLWDIAKTSDSTLYASVFCRRNKRWRVSVLRQEGDLREERQLDTNVISREQPQRTDLKKDYIWELSRSRDKRMAIVTRLDNCEECVYRWESVYIYREEKCIHRARLDIERDMLAMRVCYTGSHLIVHTGGNRVAVVALEAGNNIRRKEKKERQKTSRETMNGDEKNSNSNPQNKRREKQGKKSESGKMEESTAGSIKHVTLQDTNDICGLAWVTRDNDNVEMEQAGSMLHTTTNSDGYLFVGDVIDHGRHNCSVYELDLDRVKDGDRLNSRKDVEIDAMLPMCMIDNSNLFAIQFNPSNEQNPVILTLEFN